MNVVVYCFAVVGLGVVVRTLHIAFMLWIDEDENRFSFRWGLLGLLWMRAEDKLSMRKQQRLPATEQATFRATEFVRIFRKCVKKKHWPAYMMTDAEYEELVGSPRVVLKKVES